MKPRRLLKVLLTLSFAQTVAAQTFTWTNLAGGSWATAGNWNTTPTFGSDVVLDFSTLDITANATTTLDGARTAGTLKFGDATTASNDWIVNTGTSGPLTLATTTGTPVIQVVNRTATINAVLAGTQGFEKTGTGTLLLGHNSNNFTGGVTVSAGTLQLGNLASGTHTFSGTALGVASGATLSMAGSSGGTVTHTYNFGGNLGSTSDTTTANALQLNGGTLAFSSTNATTKAFNARIHTTGSSTISYSSSNFTHNLNLNRAITGTGTLTFNWSGDATGRNVSIAAIGTTGTAHNFTGAVILNSGSATTNFNLAQSLGATSYEIRNGWRLNNNVSGGLNSASAITLVGTGSILNLGANAWTNSSATLTANNGTILLGTGASSIGSFVLNSSGTVTLNADTGGSLSVGTPLDIRQGTLSGTGGLTSSLDLAKTTSGTAIINTNNILTGGTTISEGTLQVGNGGTTGTIGTGDITNNGTLILNRSDAQSWNQQISGSGSFTIRGGAALTLTSTQSYTGTTRIEGGSSLTLSGTGGNRLATISSLAFAGTSSLALGSNNQTVASLSLPAANADSSTTITGSGTLTINGASPFNFGVSGNIGSNVRTAAMDMTGLAGFTFNSPTQVFRVSAQPSPNNVTTSGSGRPDSSFLASNNTSITALSFLVGDQAGTGTGGNNTFRLGETTDINANTINIGASGRSNATLNFNTGLTTPIVTIRGTDGASRVNNWEIGRVAHFNSNTWTATADFSGGEIDALVNNLRIGILNTTGQINRQGTQNSTFTMGKGVLDVSNLIIGEQSGTYANNAASGTYAANGTFTLNHSDGLLKANSIRLAENTGDLTGGTRSVSGTVNLQAGTIEASEIRLGDQTATNPATITRNFNFSGGTVRNLTGGDLAISNIPVNLTGAGTRVFEATAGQSITITTDAVIGGTGGFAKAGLGSMTVESTSTYSGDTLVSAGSLFITGQLTNSNVTVQGAAMIGGTGIIGGDLDFDPGSFLRVMDLNDPLAVTGTITFGSGFGIANVTNIDWDSLDLNTAYTIISTTQTFTALDIANFGLENAADVGNGRLAYFRNGSLQVVVIPEPGAALLGGIGVLLLLRRRRP
jgi:fibronectin-binding autotransporter adhesin